MADITIKVKGLTGTLFDITIDNGLTWSDLRTAVVAVEGGNITTSMHGQQSLVRDLSINSSGGSTTTFAANGIVTGDEIICRPRRNANKETLADQKNYIAEAKRQGLAAGDTAATYYRNANVYDKTLVPNPYEGNDYNVDDDENTGALVPKRPWDVGSIAAPLSIEDAVQGESIADLQIWYDGSDSVQFQPTGPSDEQLITQWNDKSGTAKNANPSGGNNAKPKFESSDLQNTHEYVKFDGSDNLTINPFNEIDGAAAFTLLMVSTFDTVSGTEYLVDTTTGDFGIFSDAGTIKLTMNGYAATTNKTVSTGAWYIHTLVYTGGGSPALVYRLNKSGASLSVTSGSVPAATGSTTIMTLGNNDGKTAGLSGSIGEVIMFDKVLSSTEYENLENYLETKWDAIP
jgi:hypothetical protein